MAAQTEELPLRDLHNGSYPGKSVASSGESHGILACFMYSETCTLN